MKKLSIDAVNYGEAVSFGIPQPSIKRLRLSLETVTTAWMSTWRKVEGMFVASTGQAEAVEGVLIEDHLGDSRQVPRDIG